MTAQARHRLTKHQNTVLRFTAHMNAKRLQHVIPIGRAMVDDGMDKLCDGGFWLLDNISKVEYYSPRWYSTLGFKDQELPYEMDTWLGLVDPGDGECALELYEEHRKSKGEVPYILPITYNTKSGDQIEVLCSGTLLKNERYMVGTHMVL